MSKHKQIDDARDFPWRRVKEELTALKALNGALLTACQTAEAVMRGGPRGLQADANAGSPALEGLRAAIAGAGGMVL